MQSCDDINILFIDWSSDRISISTFQSDSSFGSLPFKSIRNSTRIELSRDQNSTRIELWRDQNSTQIESSRINSTRLVQKSIFWSKVTIIRIILSWFKEQIYCDSHRKLIVIWKVNLSWFKKKILWFEGKIYRNLKNKFIVIWKINVL